MKVAVYSTKSYDRKYLELINAKYGLVLEFFDFMLSERTAKWRNIVMPCAFLFMMTVAEKCWKIWPHLA